MKALNCTHTHHYYSHKVSLLMLDDDCISFHLLGLHRFSSFLLLWFLKSAFILPSSMPPGKPRGEPKAHTHTWLWCLNLKVPGIPKMKPFFVLLLQSFYVENIDIIICSWRGEKSLISWHDGWKPKGNKTLFRLQLVNRNCTSHERLWSRYIQGSADRYFWIR